MTGSMGKPLAACTVLVTADRRSAELGSALERQGATVRHAPALTIVPHVDDEALLASTRALIADPPHTAVITTGIGFRGWVEAADAAGLADQLLAALKGSRIVARGPKARGALQAAGLPADWVAESETSAEVMEFLLAEGITGQRIAVQHHGAGADGLDEAFAAAGADVASLVVYRWGPPPDQAAVDASVRAAAAGELDAVVFTSAPGAFAWLSAARETRSLDGIRHRCAGKEMVAAAVGPVTAGPLRDVGIESLVPERGRLGALVRSLVTYFGGEGAAGIETVAGRLQVRRGGAVLAGRVLPLSRSVLSVLRLLAEAGGDVVDRSTLLGVLPGDSRDAHAAEVAIARLREAAGDRTLVRTVVKRGYRLNTVGH